MIICFDSINDNLPSVEFGVRRVELRVATLRSYNSVCCLDKFVCLGLIDISATFRDVWEPVPYGDIGNVCFQS